MSIGEVERLNYYREQTLGVDDFTDQQRYHRDMRRRHNLAPHTWGIVTGLELIETPIEGEQNAVEVTIRPGFAVDGYGREIIVQDPCKLDTVEFASFKNQAYREIWIAYDERNVRRTTGEECEPDGLYSRVVESYRIVVEPGARITDGLIVAGKTVTPPPAPPPAPPAPPAPPDVITPDDDSVPHQELPTDEPGRRWLVRLGSVLWDGQNGRFRPAGARRLEERRYVGVVAAEVLGPAGKIRMRDRQKPTDAAADSDDLVGVEGTMRVDGLLTARQGLQLDGDRIDLRDDLGGDDPAFQVYRQQDAAIRVRIGDDEDGDHRFSVGTGDPAFKEKLIVRDNGNTDVKGRLDVTGRVLLNERLDIRDAQGQEGPGPVRIVRETNDVARNDVQVVIGSSDNGDDKFLVGPLDGGDFKPKFSVASDGSTRGYGKLRITGDLQIDGGAVDLRLADGGTDTDPITISRYRSGSDNNHLRMVIGDNAGGGDTLQVGPVLSGTFTPRLTVYNDGDAEIAQDLEVGGDIELGGVILKGTQRLPIDVVTGTMNINVYSDGTGTKTLTVSSRFSSVTDAFAIVTPMDYDTYSSDTTLIVEVTSKAAQDANTYDFTVKYTLDDIGLYRVAYVVVFIP